ncbi:MAG: SDR family NAD(P)-dependent oxidoreductase [Actinomycetota bacterium]|nr:SDR family NAD(P)-dependent oxidoreductase [Actinomycetota bacterium]
MQVQGSSALVVGGAGGLGAATVRRLVKAGAKVVIADLAEETGQQLAAELGDATRFVRTDVLSEDSVNAAIAAAQELGELRISVDTHGGPGGGRTLDRNGNPLGLDEFMKVVQVFLHGSFNVLRLAAAAMAKNEPQETGERGVIVNTASIAGYEGTIGQVAYGAAKGGIIGMTLPAARDLSVVGIRVGTIAPGVFATPAYGQSLDAVEAEWGPAVPFPKRMGHPDEYAHMAMAIIENPYFNGEVIRLDAAIRFQIKGSRS